jgi:hypothetical protein
MTTTVSSLRPHYARVRTVRGVLEIAQRLLAATLVFVVCQSLASIAFGTSSLARSTDASRALLGEWEKAREGAAWVS